jgi:hypothetical protein
VAAVSRAPTRRGAAPTSERSAMEADRWRVADPPRRAEALT